MAERTALLYENRSAVESFDSLRRALGGLGIQLTYPGSEYVKMLDDEGGQVEGTLSELRDRLSTESCVSFQWWFDVDHDLYCRIRRQCSACAIELGMEGCCEGELNLLGKVLRKYFVSGRGVSTGFVFDSQGVAEDYDWDRFFLRGELLDWSSAGFVFPAMLGLLSSDMDRIRGLPDAAVVVYEEGLVIIDGPG